MRAPAFVLDLIALPPWMARATLRLSAFYFLLLVSITVAKSGTNALFLARADPERLPFLYVAVAGCVLLMTWLLGRVLGRATPARVLTGATIVFAIGFVALVAAVLVGVPFSEGALYVVGEVYATALNILFWARVADAFSTRNLRRAIGPLSAAGMAGAMVGGLVVGVLAEAVGLLFPMIVTLAASTASLPLLAGLRSRSRRTVSDERPPLGAALRELTSRRFPAAVAVLVVTLAALGAAVDFVFRVRSAELFDEDGMAALFGWLNAAVGVGLVLVQGTVTPRLLARLGLFWFTALVPALLLVIALGVPLLPATWFWPLLVLKAVEMAGAFSLYNASITLLYNPMPAQLRSQLRTLIDGAVKKGGAALAGLALGLAVVMGGRGAVVGAPAVLAAVALLWLLPLKRWYLSALDERLGKRQHGRATPHPIDPRDGATRAALIRATDDDEPERVLHALQALGGEFLLKPERIVKLLAHPDERVRQEALQHVPPAPDPVLTTLLLRAVREETARRPRAAAIRALARCAPGAEQAMDFLTDDDPGAACAAIEVCLSGDEAPQAAARARLDEQVAAIGALSPAWRRELAQLLGRLDEQRYDNALIDLVHDEQLSVRRLAIEAVGRERHPAHLPVLLESLAERQTRVQARQALTAYGDLAVAALSDALDDVTLPLSVRIHIPRALAAIGTDDAARALLYSNPRDNAYLQQRIADRLVEIAGKRPQLTLSPERVFAAIERRLVLARHYTAAVHELDAVDVEHLTGRGDGAVSPLRFLRRAVVSRRDQNLRVAFQLLGLRHGLDRMMSAWRALVRASDAGAERQAEADALELLDVALAGHPQRARLLSLLEPEAREAPPTDAEGAARVHNLAKSPDPLLRAVGRRVASLLPRGEASGQANAGDGSSFRALSGGRVARDTVAPPPGVEALQADEMPDSVVDRLLFLENVDLFEGLGVDDLAAIAGLCEEIEQAAGARIYRAGEVGDCLYIIARGRVQLSRDGVPLLEHGPGESIGQVSFLDRGTRPVDAHVAGASPATLLRLERGAFLDLLSDRPGLMQAFFGVLGARLRALIDQGGHS